MDENIYGNTFTDVPKPFNPRPEFVYSCCGYVQPIRNYVNTVEGPVSNIINISAQIIPTLHVKLYNVNPNDNKEIDLHIGERYKVTYVTEDGVLCALGRLTDIGNMVVAHNPIPMITGAPTDLDFVNIRLDCSEDNQSKIITIYLRSIREIEKVVEEPPVEEPTPPEDQTTPVE